MSITAKYLRQRLHYDPSTGVFTWLALPGTDRWTVARNAQWTGREAGSIDTHGHVQIEIDGVAYAAHRLAWLYQTGSFPAPDIDHADTDGRNNRWSNLRLATQSQNSANARTSRRNSLGLKGVSRHSQLPHKWRARIMVNYRSIFLGSFNSPEEAAAAYANAAKQYFGEFGRAA